MPRRCPSEVITHRIELGTAERVQLKKLTKSYERDKWLENIPNALMGVGAVAGGVGVIGVGYGLYKIAGGIWEWAGGIMEPLIPDPSTIPAATHEGGLSWQELFWGAPEYTNYDTGTTVKNPHYGVPLWGSLYGSGINIGIAATNWAGWNQTPPPPPPPAPPAPEVVDAGVDERGEQTMTLEEWEAYMYGQN